LILVLDRFSAGGFAALAEAWTARNAWQDRPVTLLQDGQTMASGICRGADWDGSLLVEGPRGLERHLAGDLSLRSL
jgi:BirA family biotin operon repressor/biotin-[acetyl-CoA-carboxylase] ligase